MMSDASELMRVVHALAEYLLAHPQASDTAEGIARWWLRADPQVSAAQLQQALDWMEGKGLINKVVAGDGRVRWRRSEDAAAFERAVADLGVKTGRREH
jgi:Fe2+ or Zn2+ uptake regulation protein